MPIEISIRCVWCKNLQPASEFPVIPARTSSSSKRQHIHGQYCRTCLKSNPDLSTQIRQANDDEVLDR